MDDLARRVATLAPTLEPGFARRLLNRFGVDFAQREDLHAIADDLAHLARLDPSNPLGLRVQPAGEHGVDCTVYAFDRPFVLSIVTGVLFATGVSITAGEIFTAAQDRAGRPPRARFSPWAKAGSPSDPTRDAVIVDRFRGELVDPTDTFDAWADRFEATLRHVLALLERGDEVSRSRARQRVNELVTARLNTMADAPDGLLLPLTLDLQPHPDGTIRVTIVGQDTPAFLFTLSTALSLHGLDIRRVHIESHDDRVTDIIDVLDARGGDTTQPQMLERIRLCVLLTKQFTYFLGQAPDPLAAIERFSRLVDDLFRAAPALDASAAPEGGAAPVDWLDRLSHSRTLRDLARLLGTSSFLWEDFIRGQYESLAPILEPQQRLVEPMETIPLRLQRALEGAVGLAEQQDRLNRFKDAELFRIDLAHILDPAPDFRELSARLTALAEALVAIAAGCVYDDLVRSFGAPAPVLGRTATTGRSSAAASGQGLGARAPSPPSYALFGLGKLGGVALGYASDIELLFVYPGDGQTAGGTRKGISHLEFFETHARETASFLRTKREGIFEVDLRLRPYGKDGPLAVSLDQFERYYNIDEPPVPHVFERLALVRLRWVAGDPALGYRVEQLRDRFVYDRADLDLDALWSVWARHRKQKLTEHAGVGGPTRRSPRPNAKHSPGGLVDLETAIQLLQVTHASTAPQLRTPRVGEAMAALHRAGALSSQEFAELAGGYEFLRRLINALRILRGNARDLFLPPREDDEFIHVARRMHYPDADSAERLAHDWDHYTRIVREFIERRFDRPTPSA